MKTTYDEFRERHPWLLRWEGFKLAVSERWHGAWKYWMKWLEDYERRKR